MQHIPSVLTVAFLESMGEDMVAGDVLDATAADMIWGRWWWSWMERVEGEREEE